MVFILTGTQRAAEKGPDQQGSKLVCELDPEGRDQFPSLLGSSPVSVMKC